MWILNKILGIENYIGFLIAGIILNITPGNDTIYILTRSIAQGRKAGYYSVLGIVSGAAIHTLFAALGLSVILMQSSLLFHIIKYVGVAYLAYLGIIMLVSKKQIIEINCGESNQQSLRKVYRQGFLTNLLNPKVALFYLSFLPQFISAGENYGPLPFLILGFTFMTTGTLWCLFLAYGSSKISQTLRKNDKIGFFMQKLSGLVFIGLGLNLLAKGN